MKTMILVDSSCDLPRGFMAKHKDFIDVIGIPIAIGDKEYFDDLGETFDHKGLYPELRDKIKASTTQISSQRFYDRFTKYVKAGYDVLYIGLSKTMSKTNRNALKAANNVQRDYPQSKIKVLESISASIGLGLLANIALEMAQRACDVDEIFNWIADKEKFVQHWFTVEDLYYLKNGGRLSNPQQVQASILKLKPILNVDHEGNLVAYHEVRGRKKAISFMYNELTNRLNVSLSNKLMIGHGDALEDALYLKEILEKNHEDLDIMVTQLSSVIAAHVGPKMLAVAYMGDSRP